MSLKKTTVIHVEAHFVLSLGAKVNKYKYFVNAGLQNKKKEFVCFDMPPLEK